MDKRKSQVINPTAILRGIWRRHKVLVSILFVTIAAPGVLYVYQTSRPQFVSSATIAIETSPMEQIPFFRDIPRRDNVATHMVLLRSRSLSEGVIEALPRETFNELLSHAEHRDYILFITNLIKRWRGQAPTVLSPQQQALAELQNARMEFSQSRESSGIFTIKGSASSPRVAMDLVNAHIQVLLSRTRNVNQEEAQRARQFLELQVQQTKEALGQTEDALNKFQQQKGRIRLGTQTELDIVKLSQNENALAEAQASLEVLRARANALRQAINASQAKTANLAADSPAQGGRDSESMLTVLSPEQEAKLREFRAAQERLTRLEARLANLRERYTEAYPLIQVTQDEVAREQANVAQLAKQIPALPVTRDIRDARTGRPAPQAASVERSEAQRQLAALEIEEAAQLAKVETLRLQVDRLRKSLRNLNEEETEFSNLRRNVESQRNLLTVLNDKLMAARIREQGDNGVIRIIDPASFPLQPTRTKTQKLLLMVFGAAFLAALGVAGTIEFVRQPVETEDDVKGIVSFPLLGSVSSFAETAQKKNRKLSAATTALPIQLTEGSVRGSIHTELYRAIRANIEAERLKNPFRSLLVTSAAPGEGKSTTTINLGQVFREFGRRVLIVDADLRRPALHKALSIANSPGLVDLLKGSATLDQVVRSLPGGLAVIPGQATREDPAALLASPRFISLLTEPTAELYDLILLDSAPVLAVPDNLLLAPAVDRVLLVAKSSSTSKRDLLRTSQTLQKVSATVLGVILNEAHHVDVHYYNPRYRKYYTHTPPEAPPQKPNMSKSRLFAWKDKGKGV